jgi:hypothetical protein
MLGAFNLRQGCKKKQAWLEDPWQVLNLLPTSISIQPGNVLVVQ